MSGDPKTTSTLPVRSMMGSRMAYPGAYGGYGSVYHPSAYTGSYHPSAMVGASLRRS